MHDYKQVTVTATTHDADGATVLGDRVGERIFSERIGGGRAMYLVLRTIGTPDTRAWRPSSTSPSS